MATLKKITHENEWLSIHVIMECTHCELERHSFLIDDADTLYDHWFEFKMQHVLCSGDEVDIVTGEIVA
jgi:hypothetical protein